MTIKNKFIVGLALSAGLLSLTPSTAPATPIVWKDTTATSLDAPIPLDPKVTHGKLSNGFEYFILKNQEPKDRVIMYLANKVGSILETDKQQGLAHFLEHMNFNGTEHFPKNELINYLQKAGVRFGADLNAYTGLTETVYQLPIPSDNGELVKNGILIMRDWAHGALLEAEEIDQERGVILEEKRQRGGLAARMQEQTFPIWTNNSLYARRMPIGTEEVLKNFKHKEIRKFHKDWYRPELQALIVVGDIDVEAIEKEIIQRFEPLKNPKRAPKHFEVNIPLTGKNQFLLFTDAEVTSTSLQILYKEPLFQTRTLQDYRTTMAKNIFIQLVNERLGELTRKSATPFLGASVGSSPLLANLQSNSIQLAPKPGKLQESVTSVFEVLEQVKRYGFTTEEFERVRTQYQSSLARSAAEVDKTPSKSYVQELLDHYLKGSPAPAFDLIYPVMQQHIGSLEKSEVEKIITMFDVAVDRDMILASPIDSEDQATEAEIDQWISTARQGAVTAYEEEAVDQSLIGDLPAPGTIVKREHDEHIGTETLWLNNGIKVILKKTDFKNDEVLFTSYSPGGHSLYPIADYQSAVNAASVVSSSGLGGFNSLQLSRHLNGKTLSVTPYINEIGQGIRGFSINKDLETTFELVHAYFTNTRLDRDINESNIERSRIGLLNRHNNPAVVFQDSIAAILYQGDPRRTGPTAQKLDQINLDRSWEIFKDRFADASGFTFVFVGNFDQPVLETYLMQYLATLPNLGRQESFQDVGPYPLDKGIQVDIKKGKEEKSTVAIAYLGSYDYNEKDNLLMEALSRTINNKLIERLREKEGGIYSVSVSPNTVQNPRHRFSLNISFTTDPHLVDKLVRATHEEIEAIKQEGPSQEDLDKFVAEKVLANAQAPQQNSFWVSYLLSSSIDKLDPARVLLADEKLKAIRTDDIRQIATKYLTPENYFQFVLYPEEQK